MAYSLDFRKKFLAYREKTWAQIKKHLRKVLANCDTFFEALLSCSCFNQLYIPKGVSLNSLTSEELDKYITAINERPRRLLQYQSSKFLFGLAQTA